MSELDNEMYYTNQDDMKEKDEFILFFKIVLGKTSSAARNWLNSFPQTEATTVAFSSVSLILQIIRALTQAELFVKLI